MIPSLRPARHHDRRPFRRLVTSPEVSPAIALSYQAAGAWQPQSLYAHLSGGLKEGSEKMAFISRT